MPVGLHCLILTNIEIFTDFPIMKFHENSFGSSQDITSRKANNMAELIGAFF
jgi:hypothetical protein